MLQISLIVDISWRQITQRYKNSLFGIVWLLISPLLMVAVYTIVFSKVFSAKVLYSGNAVSYGIYVCMGIVFWTYFNELVLSASDAILRFRNLIKKLNLPLRCVFASSVVVSSVNFLILFVCFCIFFFYSGGHFSGVSFAITVILLVQIALASSIGILFGFLAVFFKDFPELLRVVLQLWFWATPIVYPISILPEPLVAYMAWNPLANIMFAYQQVLFDQSNQILHLLYYPASISFLILFTSALLAKSHRSALLDEL